MAGQVPGIEGEHIAPRSRAASAGGDDRRSNKAPRGYHLAPHNKALGDLPYCYGVTKQVERFPQDLPPAIGQEMGMAAFQRRARERIASLPFQRPPEHSRKLRELSFNPESFQRV